MNIATIFVGCVDRHRTLLNTLSTLPTLRDVRLKEKKWSFFFLCFNITILTLKKIRFLIFSLNKSVSVSPLSQYPFKISQILLFFHLLSDPVEYVRYPQIQYAKMVRVTLQTRSCFKKFRANPSRPLSRASSVNCIASFFSIHHSAYLQFYPTTAFPITFYHNFKYGQRLFKTAYHHPPRTD